MSMTKARVILVALGILLPYLARLPGGQEWLEQYTQAGLDGWFLIGAFNAIAWGVILVVSFAFERPVSLVAPCLLGFGFLGWAHATLDLRSDAQASLALLFIPIVLLVPIGLGAVAGYAVDRFLRHKNIA